MSQNKSHIEIYRRWLPDAGVIFSMSSTDIIRTQEPLDSISLSTWLRPLQRYKRQVDVPPVLTAPDKGSRVDLQLAIIAGPTG